MGASQKAAKDPEGGSWPAYPSGKSWDDASGPTGSGKKFYHNVISGSQVASQPFYVAIITPVIHYCMGGSEVNAKGQVMGKSGPIAGLYAAGEVAGGVHGNNRLGGNSLLDCVVFGRVTAREAAKFMLGDAAEVDNKRLQDLRKLPAKKAAAPVAAKGGGGGMTMAEVAKHTTKDDCWVVVSGQVLNVTKFLGEHPGGELAILTFAGKDATEEFNMIHPADVIGKYAPDAVI